MDVLHPQGQAARSSSARDLAVCNGKILIADNRAVLTYDGEKLSEPNPLPQGYIRRISCAGNGYLVVASRTIGLWNGSGWKFWNAETLLKDEKYKSISDAAMDKDGTIWFVAFGGVAGRIKGDAVKIWKQNQGFDRRMVFSRIVADKDGKVYIPQYRGLYTPDGDNWKLVAGPGGSNIAQAPDGALWLSSGTRINRFANGSWKSFRIDHSVRDIAVEFDRPRLGGDRVRPGRRQGRQVGMASDAQLGSDRQLAGPDRGVGQGRHPAGA